MFAPNSVPSFHHRSSVFHEVYQRAAVAFKALAGLDENWSVAFLTGSGALALEAAVATATRPITPLFVENVDAEFSRRLADLTFLYGKHGIGTEDVAYVQYETALSEHNNSGWKAAGVTLVDAVSAFPYYLPPEDADILITVSGKQLGAPPGIAIIAAHSRVWSTGFFNQSDQKASYLNLNRLFLYAWSCETPNTPAISVLNDLCEVLERYDRSALIRRVDSRYSALKAEIGEGPMMLPPVYTFKDRLSWQDGWGLYGKKRTQLFLWDDSPKADLIFDALLNKIRSNKNESPCSAFWGDGLSSSIK